MEQILSNRIVDQVLNRLTSPLRNWLAAHPVGYWLVSHPLWLVGLILISLLLLSGLFGAIAQLTQRLWILVLQAPLLLTRWIFTAIFQLFGIVFRWKEDADKHSEDSRQRLAEILSRLEVLKQEQDELLKEAKTILAVKEIV
jgi:CBS domain containing-hemolysin-like protein